MHDIENINENLVRIYGTNLTYQPLWRVVFAPDLMEKRFVSEPEFIGSLFHRFFSGVKEKPKYPKGIWGECFILERMFSSMHAIIPPPDDVINWDGYEPFWSFMTGKGKERKPIRPTWSAVNHLVRSALYGHRQTLTEAWDAEEKKYKNEAAEIREMLDDDIPWKILQMKHGEGIVVPNNFERSTSDA